MPLTVPVILPDGKPVGLPPGVPFAGLVDVANTVDVPIGVPGVFLGVPLASVTLGVPLGVAPVVKLSGPIHLINKAAKEHDAEIHGKKKNRPAENIVHGPLIVVANEKKTGGQMLEKGKVPSELVVEKEKNISVKHKRTKYPFDPEDSNECYMSEIEEDDDDEFTSERRRVKDNLELELRMVDCIKNPKQAGDDEIVSKFYQFMQVKKKKANKVGEFSKLKQVSTVDMYTRAVKNSLIPAFHRLVTPFDARWILDCETVKQCTINGEPRRFVEPEEPIYLICSIMKEALIKINSYCGESGSERGTLLCATTDFIDFIELEFNNKMGSYGPGPSEKLYPYHNGVRKFLKSTGEWKMSNGEKSKAHQTRKVLEQYENPNRDLEILQNYKKYITSSERLSNYTKVLSFDSDDCEVPSNGEITEIGQILTTNHWILWG